MIAAAAGWFCAAALAASPTVELSREGGAFRVRAEFAVEASTRAVWEVLTDYDGMTRFVPSLRKSRVAQRTTDGAIIEQEGSARLLLFSRRIALTLKVVERPPGRIEFRGVGGDDFEEYDGVWTVSASAARSDIAYELFAELKPTLIPRGIARRVLESTVRRQLEDIRGEIERRSRALK